MLRSRDRLVHWGQPLQVLLIKRSNHPSIGCFAAPGGFVELREDLYDGAARELYEETGIKGLPLQQMRTWGNYRRDPRWRVITTSYLALVEGDIPVRAGDDAAEAVWMDVSLKQVGEDRESKKEIWELVLLNRPSDIRLRALVGLTREADSLLPQEQYELLESEGLAVDHGCIITQALLYLRGRCLSLKDRTAL